MSRPKQSIPAIGLVYASRLAALRLVSCLISCLASGLAASIATGEPNSAPAATSTAAAREATDARVANEPLPDPEAGARVFAATGGCTCHTNYPGEEDDAPRLAGGRALETPFGIYYSTNITNDPETGLGKWTDEDFIRAMREGLSPEGEHYFPVFPYTAFSGLSDQDLRDLRAYLASLPSIRRENRAPGAIFPFSWRAAILGWKWMNFEPKRLDPVAGESAGWNRGRYLVEAAAHCGECHTPRTLTGGLDASMSLAGSADGPEGQLAPNITPDAETGIGSWTFADFVWYLETGLKPDGDDTQGLMSEVIEHGYANLPREDLEAIVSYMRSIPAITNQLRRE